jgi:hypothetical protein
VRGNAKVNMPMHLSVWIWSRRSNVTSSLDAISCAFKVTCSSSMTGSPMPAEAPAYSVGVGVREGSGFTVSELLTSVERSGPCNSSWAGCRGARIEARFSGRGSMAGATGAAGAAAAAGPKGAASLRVRSASKRPVDSVKNGFRGFRAGCCGPPAGPAATGAAGCLASARSAANAPTGPTGASAAIAIAGAANGLRRAAMADWHPEDTKKSSAYRVV